MSYTNADGVLVRTGSDQGTVTKSGTAVEELGGTLIFEIDDFTQLGTAATTYWNYQTGLASTDADYDKPPQDAPYIPANALITRAFIVQDAAATTGTTSALNVGLYTKAGVAIDADGIDAAVDSTVLAADDAVVCNGILVGIANVGSADAYVGVDYDTAVFTAGSCKIVIEYINVL